MTEPFRAVDGDPGAPDDSDEALAERLRSDDREAMTRVYDRYADRVYNHCYRRTWSWSLAEDAMAATFLEAWRIRARATTYGDALFPWLFAVADNTCRNLLRSQRRQAAVRARLQAVPVGAEHEEDIAEGVADRVDGEGTVADLAAAVQRLGRRDRQVLVLVAWDGLTYQQAAEVLGVPVGTVRSRLSRSRRRLAELMNQPTTERNA